MIPQSQLRQSDELKDFQRRTVDHVTRRMLDEGTRRFLVADEVGLGKTLVARGVIANAVARLQEDGVKRIDVVYVCSNQEIARQNLARLQLPGYAEGARLSRIGLMPLQMDRLVSAGVNFVSLTPGTSLDPKSRGGWSLERAILLQMLREPWEFRVTKNVKEVFRLDAGWPTMRWHLEGMGALDATLCERFASVMVDSPLRAQFRDLVDSIARRGLREAERELRLKLIGALRRELSRICVAALEPDVVILDEFQRFAHLLDGESEDAVLARQLFAWDNGRGEFARVLLLSATPYKAYTRAEEHGPSHQSELLRLLRFLYEDDARARAVEDRLRHLRELLLAPQPSEADLGAARTALEAELSAVMVRTERLACSATRNGMLIERDAPQLDLRAGDVQSWLEIARLHRVLREHDLLASPAAVSEFWKSAPWLAQFMDQYAFKKAIANAARLGSRAHPDVIEALRTARKQLNWNAFQHYKPLAPPNGRLRSLAADTVDRTWDLLWMPPSMPYYLASAPFDRPDTVRATKRLTFSAWHVVPRAIAAYLSYEAERHAFCAADPDSVNTKESRTIHERRLLDFGIDRSDPTSPQMRGMPVLAWLYPSPTLADLGDPRAASRALANGPPTADAVLDWAAARVRDEVATLLVPEQEQFEGRPDQRWYWAAPLLLDLRAAAATAFWATPNLHERWSGSEAENWSQHVDAAAHVYRHGLHLGRPPDDLVDVLALMAVASPAVASYRAVRGVLPTISEHSAQLLAARLAWGMRHVFNAPEATAIVSAKDPDPPYWRATLRYALHGNVQAMLDEWLHLLAEDAQAGRKPDDEVLDTLRKRIDMVLGLGAGRIEVDRLDNGPNGAWRTHFAIRYGQFKEDATHESHHPEAVRRAFNSPFRPFVLASTSVGQEGLDFHTYCHAIVHWNVPASPIDLEQREGRVHRYKGHAVRLNVASQFAREALSSGASDPWQAAFDAAEQARSETQDDLVPYWLQDGPASIERYVPALPFSKDSDRLKRVLERVTLYRMVFGQPRQDDLLTYLRDHIGQEEAERLAGLVTINLSPKRQSVSPSSV